MSDLIYTEDGTIDLISIFKELWASKIKIIVLGLIFAVSSSIFTLFMPQYWTASSTLMTVEEASAGGGAAGSSLASMVGVSLGSSSIDKGQIASEIAKSKDFFKYLIQDEQVLVNLIAISGFKDEKNVYDPKIYDVALKKWVREKPTFHAAYEKYRSTFSFSYDWERGGFMEASVTHRSPAVAKTLLDKIIVGLNDQYRARDLKEADKSLEYLSSMASSVTNADLRRSMSSLMQNQLKTKMFANVREYYLVEPLDSVYQPQLRSKPKRTRIVLLSTFIGLLLSCMYIIFRKQFPVNS
jgi:capsular polysaccharide biosynthesis protein